MAKDTTTDWREIIYRGVESQELDYKAAQNWLALSRVGKAKFARHAMAMANTVGGYLVVGVGEDENGNPNDYTGLTEAQVRSFDPSTVGQFINRYADPGIDFDIVRPEVDNRHYAVFVIRRFLGLPHVTSDHCGDELQQGVFYIRTADAQSRPAYRASELHGLVQRALRNQRETLGRMLRGVLYEGRQLVEPEGEREFQRQIQESHAECRGWLGPRNLQHFRNIEMAAYPTEFEEDILALSTLKKAVQNVALPVPGNFPWLNGDNQELFFTNFSLLGRSRSEVPERFYCWQVFQSGLLHHVSSLVPREEGAIPYPLLVQRLAASVRVLGELYSELGFEDQLLTFTVTLTNMQGAVLSKNELQGEGEGEEFRCYIPEIVVKTRRTVADLTSGPVAHAQRVIHEVCERFNFAADQHPELRHRLLRFLG